MEALALLGGFQSLLSLMKAIYKLQETVVKHKEDVEEFTEFIRKIEREVTKLESRPNSPFHGRDLLEVEASLGKLLKFLEASKQLLGKLQSRWKLSRRRIKKLREQMNEIRTDILWAKVFDEQPVRPSGTPSYYPPGDPVYGWKAYRSDSSGTPPDVDGRNPDSNHLHPSP